MKKKRLLSLLLALMLLLCACGAANTPLEQTAAYLKKATPEPAFGSLNGDWTVFGLARSGVKVDEAYYEAYYKNVVEAVTERGGTLSETKYTEYSRLVLALTAIGRDVRDVGGYDLLMPLADLDRATLQGVNGAIFALLALGLRVIFAYALHNTSLFGYTAIWWSQAMAWTVTLLVCYVHVFRGKWKNKSLI